MDILSREHGLEPSRDKVRALTEMPAPKSKEEVRRFLGMIQYLAKFIPDLECQRCPAATATQERSWIPLVKGPARELPYTEGLLQQGPGACPI